MKIKISRFIHKLRDIRTATENETKLDCKFLKLKTKYEKNLSLKTLRLV